MKLPYKISRLLRRFSRGEKRGVEGGREGREFGKSLFSGEEPEDEGERGQAEGLSRSGAWFGARSGMRGVRCELEEAPENREDELPVMLLLAPEQLLEGDGQPRRDFVDSSLIALADSIRMHGLMHPVTVRPLPGSYSPERQAHYAVVAGERRLRAMEILGRRRIPCILVDVTPEEAAAMALVENIHRQNLSPFEEADAAAYLRDCERPPLSHAELGKLLSMSHERVRDKLALRCFGARERQLLQAADLPEDALVSMTEAGSGEERIALLKAVCRKYAEEGSAAAFVRGYLSAQQAASKIGGAKRKLILGDIRIFYNTVDKAVQTVRDAGIPAVCKKEEEDDRYRITIEILKGRMEPDKDAVPAGAQAPPERARTAEAVPDGEEAELLPEALRRRATRTLEIPSVR